MFARDERPRGFVAYVDEAGDVGLRSLRTARRDGATRWFTLGCVVVREPNDAGLDQLVSDILKLNRRGQRTDIHFRHLPDWHKQAACDALARHPIRLFAAMSWKQSLVGYQNANLPPGRDWFYRFMVRLLFERVTKFCAAASDQWYGRPLPIRIVFAHREDQRKGAFQGYFEMLRRQSQVGRLVLKSDLDWSVVDVADIHTVPAASLSGLQLADIVASSFQKAVEPEANGFVDTHYADRLKPRLHQVRGDAFEKGVKVMPRLSQMRLTSQQRSFLESLRDL